MIRSRLHLRHDTEIGAQENGAEFRDQLFARTFRPVLRVARQISIEAMLSSNPVNVFVS